MRNRHRLFRLRRSPIANILRGRFTRRRQAAEALEDRTLLATFVVDTLVDESDGDFSAGDFSLREAIERANSAAHPNADLITFAPALTFGTIDLAAGELVVDGDLEIRGPGRDRLRVDGNDQSRVFHIRGDDVLVSGLWIYRGSAEPASSGGGLLTTGEAELQDVRIESSSATRGGGISNTGRLTIVDSHIVYNSGTEFGGGIDNSGELTLIDTLVGRNSLPDGSATTPPTTEAYGGGLYNTGSVLAIRSSITGNRAVDGGGVYQAGGSFVTANSSFLYNAAYRNGGAIYATTSGAANLQLINVTIVENYAQYNSALYEGDGGGLFLDGDGAYLANTLIAGNVDEFSTGTETPDDVFGTLAASSRHNLVSDPATAGGLTDGVAGNIVGDGGTGTIEERTLLISDHRSVTFDHVDELPLYGAQAPMRALTGYRPDRINPAIDSGSNALAQLDGVPLSGDQRSSLVERIFDGDFDGTATVDIGAWEIGQVDLTVDSVDWDGQGLNLDAAIRLAGSNPTYYGPDLVSFAWHNRVTVPATLPDLTREGGFDVGGIIELIGPGAEQFIVDASTSDFGMYVGSGSNVIVSGLTIRGARREGVEIDGFGLTRLEIRDVHVLNNGTPEDGGVGGGIVYHGFNPITVQVYDSVISGNGSTFGGIHLRNLDSSPSLGREPILVIQKTTISNNRSSEHGGGVYAHILHAVPDDQQPPFIIDGSTISGNESAGLGGGIYLSLGSYYADGTHQAQFTNTTISGNRAAGAAGLFLRLSQGHRYFDASNLTIVGNVGGGLDSTNRIHNSIIAGNLSTDGLSPSDVTAIGSGSTFNLIGDASTSGGLMDGVDGNIVGRSGTGTIDPMTVLDPVLADHGGPTLTHSLVVGSPALDSGDNSRAVDAQGTPLLFDQRGPGFARDLGPVVDRGAFEGIATSTDVVYVNDNFTQPDGTVIADADPNTAGDQPAMIGINAFATIQEGLDAVGDGGTVNVTDDLQSDGAGLYGENVVIDKNVTVRSTEGDPTAVVVDGGGAGSVFTLGTFTIGLESLTIQNGSHGGEGGGINSEGGVLTVSNSIIKNNASFGVLSGHGGGVHLGGGTASFTNVVMSGNTSTFAAGGLYIAGTASATLTDSMIVGNSARIAGGIHNDGGTLNVVRGLIDGNSASQRAGGIENLGGSLTIEGTTLSNNEATGDTSDSGGGAVFQSLESSTMTIRNALLTGNESLGMRGRGGAIRSDRGTTEIVDTRISGNSARRSGGGIEVGDGSVTLNNVTIEDNVVDAAGSGNPAEGGGLGISGDNDPQVTITGGMVNNNTASHNGGGLSSIEGSILNISGGTIIEGNRAQGAADGEGGGGFFVGGVLNLTGATVRNNVADTHGGGLLVAPHGRAYLSGCIVDSNTAGEEGGGAWISNRGLLILRNASMVSNNTASGAATDQGGGGIFNDGGRVAIQAGTTISRNVADGAAGSGGGIFSAGGIVTVDDSDVTHNTAVRAGGGIEFVTGTIEVTGSNVNDNSALGGGTNAPGNGGGLHVTGSAGETGYVRILDSAFRRNVAAKQGGAIWNQAGNIMTVSGTAIRKNTASGDASDDGGGGIFNNGGRLAISAVTFVFENHANGVAGSGGGIFSMGGAVTIESNTNVLENHASRAGGGLEFVNAEAIIKDTLIYDNTAGVGGSPNPGDGGGMHVTGSGSTIAMSHVTVRNNQAARQGGGLWNDAGSSLTVDFLSEVIDNDAMGDGATDGGGGIFNNGGTLNVGRITISNNSASGADGAGGGIYSTGGWVGIYDDTSISGNQATRGGGIFNGGRLHVSTSTVSSNTATDGGGIYNSGVVARVDLFDSDIDQNVALRRGGGMWNEAGAVMALSTNARVTANRASGPAADDGGGGVFNNGGRLALGIGASVAGNMADGDAGSGGGILSLNGVVTLFESSITNNTAVRAGGGVELVTGVFDATHSRIDGNMAIGGNGTPGNGGGIHITGRPGQVGRIAIQGTSVSDNSAATEGGGLWNQAGNIMIVRGGSIIDGNTASGDAADDGGGGIFNNNGRLAIGQAAVISNNTANGIEGSGGGIFSMGGGVSIEGGTTIIGNAANRAGGGIEVVNGEVNVIDSSVENNNAGVTGTANPGNGGGIHISGTNFTRVDLRSSLVRNNQAAGEGGGLWNQTNSVTLVRIGSEVIGNSASGDGGGGVFSQGRLVVNAATIDGNQANGTTGRGGGILNLGAVTTIENSTVSNNTARRAGGGIEVVDGWVSTRNMQLADNNAGGAAPSPGNGGGLHVSGAGLSRVTIEGGTVTGNMAAEEGGGLWNDAGGIMVVTAGTTISGNTASGTDPDQGGGGIFNNGGRLAITAATLSGNSAAGTDGAGGGILSLGGGVTVDNSTISGNSANGDGGGVAIQGGELITANATITLNRSDADGTGGGIGGGLNNGAIARLKNTIVAGNLTGIAVDPKDVSGNTLQSSSHNIIGDAASAGGLIDGINGNIVGNSGSGVLALATILDPTLADNGGPTLTHALAIGSPAINTGNNALAKDVGGMPFSTDQRGVGFPRINDDTVDMGAVEN